MYPVYLCQPPSRTLIRTCSYILCSDVHQQAHSYALGDATVCLCVGTLIMGPSTTQHTEHTSQLMHRRTFARLFLHSRRRCASLTSLIFSLFPLRAHKSLGAFEYVTFAEVISWECMTFQNICECTNLFCTVAIISCS